MSNINSSELDALIFLASDALTEQNAEYLSSIDTSDTVICPATEKKILRMIRRKERQVKYEKIYSYCRRIAAVFALVCTISFAVCLSIEGVRTKIFETAVEFYEDHIGIIISQNTKTPRKIEEYREPEIVPAGTTRKEVHKSSRIYVVHYDNSEGICQIVFEQSVISSNETWYDDDCTIEEITIDGMDAVLLDYTEEKRYVLIWSDGEYKYSLDSCESSIGVDVLKSIAKSVK